MEQLKIIGVDSKGYGKIYKSIMRNKEIPVQSKALYAYLCSYAGSGTTAYPKRERILRDLQIGKNAYTKYLRILIDTGFIRRTRTPSGNIYEIAIQIQGPDGETMSVQANGYGTVPKLIMQDQSISIQAKGLYAYFCSYAGAGNKAYPRRSTILRDMDMCENAYYRHYRQLVDKGIIVTVKGNNNGKFDVSTYYLAEFLPMSPKEGYGEKFDNKGTITPMSSKKRCGGNVENLDDEGKCMSPNMMSGEMGRDKLRHANNNNSSIINTCNLSITGKGNNNSCHESDQFKFSKQQVKDLINYKKLLAEAEASANIKSRLGHFVDLAEQQFYVSRHKEIVRECSVQLYQFYLRTGPYVQIDGKIYDTVLMKQNLADHLSFEIINEVCLELADRYKTIRSVKEYVKRVILNIAAEKINPKA